MDSLPTGGINFTLIHKLLTVFNRILNINKTQNPNGKKEIFALINIPTTTTKYINKTPLLSNYKKQKAACSKKK